MSEAPTCSVCGTAPATVHLVQINDCRVDRVSFCAACAAAKVVVGTDGFVLPEFRPNSPKPRVCKACGLSEVDFLKTNLFGCEHCYDTFSDLLAGALKNSPAKTHSGKIPAGKTGENAIHDQIERLKNSLHNIVKAENYEEAARVRDEIARLETQLLPAPVRKEKQLFLKF